MLAFAFSSFHLRVLGRYMKKISLILEDKLSWSPYLDLRKRSHNPLGFCAASWSRWTVVLLKGLYRPTIISCCQLILQGAHFGHICLSLKQVLVSYTTGCILLVFSFYSWKEESFPLWRWLWGSQRCMYNVYRIQRCMYGCVEQIAEASIIPKMLVDMSKYCHNYIIIRNEKVDL